MSQTSVKQDEEFKSLPVHHYRDDEISLVDIAKTLVKRRRLMVFVFFLSVAFSVVLAFLLPQKFTYTTFYTPAKTNPTQDLEPAVSLQKKLTTLYVPTQIRSMLQQQGMDSLPFKVEVNNPKNTNLIVVSSDATETYADQVAALQIAAIDAVKNEQDKKIETRKELLGVQIKSAKQQLEVLKENYTDGNSVAIAGLINATGTLESEINGMQKGYISAKTVKSIEPKGPGKSMIIAVGIVLGGMLALMAVFIREFASKVCNSLESD